MRFGKLSVITPKRCQAQCVGTTVRECYEVEAENEGRISCVKVRISRGESSRQMMEQGRVALSYVCPHCHCLPLDDYIWCVSSGHGEKQCNWWCTACGGQYDWRAPNRMFVIEDSTDHREAEVFRAHAAAQGTCDNLINALKLLTNQQKNGDSPVGKSTPPRTSSTKTSSALFLF